jgi:hypothetical protein
VQEEILACTVAERIRKQKAQVPQVWKQAGRAVDPAIFRSHFQKELTLGISPRFSKCSGVCWPDPDFFFDLSPLKQALAV